MTPVVQIASQQSGNNATSPVLGSVADFLALFQQAAGGLQMTEQAGDQAFLLFAPLAESSQGAAAEAGENEPVQGVNQTQQTAPPAAKTEASAGRKNCLKQRPETAARDDAAIDDSENTEDPNSPAAANVQAFLISQISEATVPSAATAMATCDAGTAESQQRSEPIASALAQNSAAFWAEGAAPDANHASATTQDLEGGVLAAGSSNEKTEGARRQEDERSKLRKGTPMSESKSEPLSSPDAGVAPAVRRPGNTQPFDTDILLRPGVSAFTAPARPSTENQAAQPDTTTNSRTSPATLTQVGVELPLPHDSTVCIGAMASRITEGVQTPPAGNTKGTKTPATEMRAQPEAVEKNRAAENRPAEKLKRGTAGMGEPADLHSAAEQSSPANPAQLPVAPDAAAHTGQPELERAAIALRQAGYRAAHAEPSAQGHAARTATPPPTMPSSAEDHRAYVPRLVNSAALTAKAGEAHMQVSMRSGELGSIRLETTVRNERIEASIAVERKEAHSVLAGHLPALEQALGERDLRVGNITVLHDSRMPENELAFAGGSHQHADARPQFAASSADEPPETSASTGAGRAEHVPDAWCPPDTSRLVSVRV